MLQGILQGRVRFVVFCVDAQDFNPFAVIEVAMSVREGALQQFVDLQCTLIQREAHAPPSTILTSLGPIFSPTSPSHLRISSPLTKPESLSSKHSNASRSSASVSKS